MTTTGVFSSYFASEYVLNDIVKDSTVDIMHVYFCGMGRYMLSWVTDVLCPQDFTFQQLNARKNAVLRTNKDVRVRDVERAKATKKRGSCTIKLNGAETMHFMLARFIYMAFLQRLKRLKERVPLTVQLTLVVRVCAQH
jgi:hypothetical protein